MKRRDHDRTARIGLIVLGCAVAAGSLVSAAICWDMIRRGNSFGAKTWLWNSIMVGVAGIVIALAPVLASRYLSARQRAERGRCPECDYDLRGELDKGCPECGWGRRADYRE